MEHLSTHGKAVIFAGPSGSGKSTLSRHVLKLFPQASFSVSATTRSRRDYEIDGKDYFFLSPEQFKQKIADDEFLEWEEVYTDRFYGSLKAEVERLWKEGKIVVFDVDVEGALRIKRKLGDNALAVFVKPPSLEILKERLQGRGSESEEDLVKRIEKAEHELSYSDKFDTVLINEALEDSLAVTVKLIENFLNT